MRFRMKNGQYIPPYEAIRVAEKNNLITEVGELVLTKACQTMKLFVKPRHKHWKTLPSTCRCVAASGSELWEENAE